MSRYIFIFIFLMINLLYSKDNAKKLEEAIIYINQNDFDKAIELLEKNGEEDDLLLSIAYLGKKDFKSAKVVALQYWFKNENDILANYILAFLSEELKEYNIALMHWENVNRNAKNSLLKQLSKKHIDVLKRIK